MKMKSVVLAAATAVASSAFAQIFEAGDIYEAWFASNATTYVEFDTPLASPIAITNTPAQEYDGYAVTAEVSIVVHAELPAVPSPFDNLNPKGAICAAVTNSPSISTNWYGLSGSAWVQLSIAPAPVDNGNYTLVMEFMDKGGEHKVCYSVVGSGSSGWLDSGTDSQNKPSRVAFAGTGKHRSLMGLLVTEKVAPSASDVSWTEGYDFTNGTVSVTLSEYNSGSMGEVSLVVKNSAGAAVGSAAFGSVTQSVTPTLTPGETYTYSIVQNAGGVVTTNDVGTFVAAAPGAGFSASVQNGEPAADNGHWDPAAPAVEDAKYTISGSEVFNIDNGALEANKLVIVDNKVTFTTWGDVNDLQDFDDGTFAAITAVTNGSGTVVWKAYKGPENGWLDLVGGVTPAVLNDYDIRATFDFSGTYPKMSFAMKASGGSAFTPFTYRGSAWITSTVATNVLSEVGYSGIGKLTSVVGGNSDTNIAAVGTKSYATLADAIAAATNGSDTVTLRTNTQWPSTTPVGKYTVLTNGFSLVGLPSGEDITITPSGVGFNIVVAGGSSHISGAGNININKDDMEALDIDTSKSPAEIAAELTKPQSNGIEKWANYVLGIDGSASANKPFAAPVQNADPSKLTFSLGGVNVNEGTGATVGYSVEELASPTATSGDTHTTNEFGNVVIDVPDGVRYYRVKVTITLPD